MGLGYRFSLSSLLCLARHKIEQSFFDVLYIKLVCFHLSASAEHGWKLLISTSEYAFSTLFSTISCWNDFCPTSFSTFISLNRLKQEIIFAFQPKITYFWLKQEIIFAFQHFYLPFFAEISLRSHYFQQCMLELFAEINIKTYLFSNLLRNYLLKST